MAQKQLLQSAGDGTAVPAGYVGEVRSFTFNVNQTTTGTNQISLADQTISAGRWMAILSGNLQASNGGTGTTNNSLSMRIDGSVGSTNLVNSVSIYAVSGTTSIAFPTAVSIIDKSTNWTIGITQNLTFTSGIVASLGQIILVRIA